MKPAQSGKAGEASVTSGVARRWVALLLVIVASLLILASLAGMAAAARIDLPANTLCVKPGGGDGCQSTISQALAIANKDDVIRVAAGTYHENVTISDTVTLLGGWNASFTLRDISQFTSTITPADNTRSVVTIDGDFNNTAAVAPTLDGFTITGGRADLGSNHGGGVAIHDSDARLISNTIKNNVAFLLGGGVWVQRGAPLLQGNIVISNTSRGLGQDAHGGGVQLENSPASLIDNVLSRNVVSGTTSHGGGLEVSGTGTGVAFLRGNIFISNTAGLNPTTSFGGAIAVASGQVQLRLSTFISNTGGRGGGLFLGGNIQDCCNVSGDGNRYEANRASRGGAIFIGGMANDCCEFADVDALYRHNLADEGGALYLTANFASLGASSLISNTARVHGGAVFIAAGGSISVTNSAILENAAAQDGGAIRNSGSFSLTNSTLSGNKAGVLGGGIASFDSAFLLNATISDNSSPGGAGIMNANLVTVRNSLIAENAGDNCSGGLFSLGHNLEDGGTCAMGHGTDQNNTPAMIGGLAYYGGPAATHPLMAGSKAIDGGDNAACSAVDQRGAPRPYDGDGDGTAVCDIGAFEFGAPLPLYLPVIMK